MKIEYELSPADWLAFGMHHVNHAPVVKQWRGRVRDIGSCVVLVAVMVPALATGWWGFFPLALAAAIGWYLGAPPLLVRYMQRQWSSAVVDTRSNSCLRGRHTMEILPEGLRAVCDVQDTTLRWHAVSHVEATDQHSFVYIDPEQAYVVPRRGLLSGDYEHFFAALNQRLAAEGL